MLYGCGGLLAQLILITFLKKFEPSFIDYYMKVQTLNQNEKVINIKCAFWWSFDLVVINQLDFLMMTTKYNKGPPIAPNNHYSPS